MAVFHFIRRAFLLALFLPLRLCTWVFVSDHLPLSIDQRLFVLSSVARVTWAAYRKFFGGRP